ncbi:M28 family metallopeptidase [Microlunatus lacustris]
MADPNALRAHVTALASEPRHRAIAGSRERARSYVEAELHESGWQVTYSDFRSAPSALRTSDYGRRWWPAGAGGPISGRNVIAHRGDPEGAIWVTAHLDSVHSSPGADDNASAVAIALELGRQLDRDDVAIVLTDQEESAMLGARMLVRHGPKPRLVINLESLGYFRDEPTSQRTIPDLAHPDLATEIKAAGSRGDFVLVAYRPNSASAAATVLDELHAAGQIAYGLEDRRWNGAGQKITARLNPVGLSLDRSDHAPFWRARVPALVLTDTHVARNPNYHRPTDTPDTLDYDRMGSITQALVHLFTHPTVELEGSRSHSTGDAR